jgi:tetratricopeptide (TPR) repeat protein
VALWLHSRRLLDHPCEPGDWDDTRVEELLSAYSTLVEHAPDPWLGELVVQLMTLQERLADLTRVHDAATAVTLALTPYEKLVAADPSWTPAYCHALGVNAELCLRIGAQDQALAIAEHHVAVASAHDHGSAVHARAQETLATCLDRVGRAEEAEQASRAAVDLWTALAEANDDDPDVPSGLAHAWNTLANRLLGLDRPEEAAAAAARAATLWPADNIGRGSALYFVGVALARLDRHRQSAESFREAVAVYDDHAPLAPHQETQLSDILHNLAVAYGRLEENTEAFACASRAAAILHRQWQADPTAHHAHLLRALETLMHFGRQADDLPTAAEAARLRVTALKTHPDTDPADLAMALGDLGGLQLDLGAAQDAVESFTRSADAVPEDPSMRAMIHCRQAFALHRCDRTKDAIRLVRHAIDLLGPTGTDTEHPYLPWLAQLHHDLAVYLLADARPLEALGAVGRATPLRERLAQAGPDMHTAPLISDLELTASLLDTLDRPEQAQRTRARIKDLTC